jgi:HK97 family phage major capsid protein
MYAAPKKVFTHGRPHWLIEGRLLPVVSGGDGPVDKPEASEEYRSKVAKMTLAEVQTELGERRSEILAIGDKKPEDVTPEDEARFDPAEAEFRAAKTHRDELEERSRKLEEVRSITTETVSGDGGLTLVKGKDTSDPFAGDLRTATRSQLTDRALRVLEDKHRHDLAPAQIDRVDRLVRSRLADCDGSRIAQRLLLTENDDYRSGFMKGITHNSPVWTPEEARAINSFREFEATETRAASEGTGSAGGYGIPVLIDPSIILSSGALDAPILAISRMVTITTDAWKGVTAPGAVWTYTAEAGVVTDSTPTMTQPNIPVYKASGFIPYSIEVGQDYPGFAEEMSMVLNQGYIDLVANQSMTGSGSSSPTGIFTHLAATTASQLAVTTSGTLGGIDIRTLWGKVPERFRPRSTWLMNAQVMAIIRGLGNNLALADFTVNLLADGTQVLTGKPVVETDYAPGFTGTTGVENFLIVGDFSNFLIVQRAGMTVELVQHLFDPTTARPTGQRGWFAYARHGFDVVNANAFRMLCNGPVGVGA